MHEVSIVEGMLEILEEQRQKNNFKKVLRIEIVCGKYNCASEETLSFCFHNVISKDSYLSEAVIEVKRLPEKYGCGSCHKEFFQETEVAKCPHCESSNIIPQLNSEIYLNQLEVE